LEKNFNEVIQQVSARLTKREISDQISEDIQQIIVMLAKSTISVRSRGHNTIRPGGITYENTLVVFSDGRAIMCLTLTSANETEAPFHPAPNVPGSFYCSLSELANQRKLAAALIEDYTIRTAISSQYEVLKRLLPNL
jgi:hypothetical protein